MSNVRSYEDYQILDRIKSLPSFTHIPKGRYIVGVRSNEDETNVMDDKFYVFEKEKFVEVLTGTTHAGGSVLKGGFKKYNAKGAFVLKANEWYYDFWTYGLHKKLMPALVQVGAALGFRDGNMNGKAEEIGPQYKVSGIGINFHTNTFEFKLINNVWKLLDNTLSKIIGGWSAGCQVPNNRAKYTAIINWFKDAKQSGQQKYVTYVLLDEWDA